MAYWVDDSFATWPEVFRAGTAAAGLYVRCGAYCAANTTDGHIPLEVATSWGTREWIQKLVEVGLWETEETGYRDVYYLVAPDGSKLNPTKAEVDEKREKARLRQQKKRGKEGKPNSVTRDSRVTHTGRTTGTHGGSSRAPSLPPSKEGKGSQALPSPVVEEGADNPDWRRIKSFGAEPDPVEADRARRGAEAARAALSRPAAARARPGPVEAARQRGSSLDPLDQMLAEVIRLHPEEVSDVEAG